MTNAELIKRIADFRLTLRFVRICCPECECVQGAAEEFPDDGPWPIYVHTCMYCGYIITESEWNEVDDDLA